MAIASLKDIMDAAFKDRYGVAAFNVFNDLSMDAVLKAAEQAKSPVIIQTSVKTVQFWGMKVVYDMFVDMASRVSTPATLHLDHCPDPNFAKQCIETGWNSVLFDGSSYDYDENMRITKEMVEFATPRGVHVEGELVPVKGIEDGMGSEEGGEAMPLKETLEFIRETGIYCYAPDIGTAHGLYKARPAIRFDHLKELIDAHPIPMVLHGGTGLEEDVFHRLIAQGCAKVNISTQLKMTYAERTRAFIEANPKEHEPLKMIGAVRNDFIEVARGYYKVFGSEGRAS